MENVSELILRRNLRFYELTETDPAKIVVPFTHDEINKLWAESEPWPRACSKFLEEFNNKYPQSKTIQFIMRNNWILPHIVWQTLISGILTFYTDANKSEKAGYKSENLSKMELSPYNSVQKSELYAIFMVLMDFMEPQHSYWFVICRKSCFSYWNCWIYTRWYRLTLSFIQLQEVIRI